MKKRFCRFQTIVSVLALLLALHAVLPATGAAQQTDTHRDCTWAVQWINNGLALFMARGYVEKIAAQDEGMTIYVGSPWYRLAPSQQEEFLKNFARARLITGHDPACTVKDSASGALVAQLTRYAVELITPDGNTISVPLTGYDSSASP